MATDWVMEYQPRTVFAIHEHPIAFPPAVKYKSLKSRDHDDGTDPHDLEVVCPQKLLQAFLKPGGASVFQWQNLAKHGGNLHGLIDGLDVV